MARRRRGTGEVSCAALARGEATSVVGIDLSNGLLALAALGAVGHPRLAWQQGDANNLPFPDGSFDFVVSGLVLNFAPDRRRMVSEMARGWREWSAVAGLSRSMSGIMTGGCSPWPIGLQMALLSIS